jgi:hypothetical protein
VDEVLHYFESMGLVHGIFATMTNPSQTKLEVAFQRYFQNEHINIKNTSI